MKSEDKRTAMKADGKSSEPEGPESLEFKCPKCGCENLMEHACIWRYINWVNKPKAPHDAYDEPDPSIIYDHDYDYFFSHDYGENNFYCCEDCSAILKDEEGNPGWGAEFLYKWLLAHQPDPDQPGEN